MNTQLVKQLISSRKALKQKYKSLKSDIVKSQSSLEKNYKPITQPLKELLSTLKIDTKPELKQEKEELPSFRTSIPALFKNFREEYYHTVPEDTYQYDATLHPEGSFFDDSLQRPPTAAELEEKQLQTYLTHYHKPLPRAYIEDQIRSANKDEFDYTFGIHYNPETEKYEIGKTPITFQGADIEIENMVYRGTTGLYELLFKKSPVGYKSEDLDNYIDIIRRNNVQYLNYNPEDGINTSNDPKFKKIIKPHISTINFLTKQKELEKKREKEARERQLSPLSRPRTASDSSLEPRRLRSRTGSIPKIKPQLSSTKIGTNLDMVDWNDKKIEYRYFDDPNEIVERLRLLVASQKAGNTAHNNEIISIIEELKEAKIIE
jgi:hypothetical protein